MNYENLLKRALDKLPKKVESKSRFKMPDIVSEISGNKTIIRNFNEILSALRREPQHLSKYLFKELAAPGNIEGKILILQTKVPNEILKKKLESYVKEFVFCKECSEPDTKLIKEERIYFLKCEACGCKYPARSI